MGKQLTTHREARRIVERYMQRKDLAELVLDVSRMAWHFGRCNRRSRECFEEALKALLTVNGLKRLTVQPGIRVIRKHYPEEERCPGCGWRATMLYSFPGKDIDNYGLCGDCFLGMIVEQRRMVM